MRDLIIMFSNITQYVDKIRKQQRNKEIAAIKAIKRQQLRKQISKQDLFRLFYPNIYHQPNTSIFTILQSSPDCLYQLLPSSNPDIEQSIINIENHASFLRQLIRQLQISQSSQHFNLVIDYVRQITKRYNSLQIHRQSCYQIEFVSLASLCQNYYTIEEKQFILKWARTFETLPLLVDIVAEVHSISSQNYSNLFDIIVLGLKSNNQIYQIYSINLFQKIIKYYDKNQIFTLSQNYPIIAQLISQRISYKLKYKETFVYDEWLALLYLLNTHDEAIHDYINNIGLSFLGQMMKSSVQSTVVGALEILKIIASVQKSELYDVLLIDQELEVEKSSNWLCNYLRNNIKSNQSFRIRKSFANVIKIIIKNAAFQQIRQLYTLFSKNGVDLIEYFCQIIENEEDVDIILFGIQSIERLLFKKQKYAQSVILNIVYHLQNRNIRKRLEQLQNHSREQAREISGDLLEKINEIKQERMQDV